MCMTCNHCMSLLCTACKHGTPLRRVDSNFVYVTGVEEPDFSCLIDAESGERAESYDVNLREYLMQL